MNVTRITDYKRMGLLFALLLLVTPMAVARVAITNVEAMTEKRENPNTGKEDVWVVITYDITDVPEKGAVVNLEALLKKRSGGELEVMPNSEEVEGDIGGVSEDGSKTIEWNAQMSLTRLNKQGKYDCIVKLGIEGQGGLTSARLDITKYIPSNWEYFEGGVMSNTAASAEIIDLEQTEGFSPADSICDLQGNNWHETVEEGAIFYRGNVTRIPRWRGRRTGDIMRAVSMEKSGCSAFLAIKDQGTEEQKVWINFSQLWNMHVDANRDNIIQSSERFQWEFQFRVFEKAIDGSKALKAGNAGKPGTDTWTEWNQGESFEITLNSGQKDVSESNVFELNVARRQHKHFYKGNHVMTFFATGDGYFDTPGDNRIVLTDGDLKINEWLHFSGTFQMDTTFAIMTTFGSWSDPQGNILWTGPFIAKVTDKFGIDLTSGLPILSDQLKIGGVQVTFDSLQFVGGVDKASGVKLDVNLSINQLKSGCNEDKDSVKSGDPRPGLKFKNVSLTTEGWDLTGVEASDVGLSIAPAFCIKSMKASYDKANKKLETELTVKGPMFERIGGGLTVVDGKLDGFKFDMKLAQGGVPIPLPPPPGHVLEWRGFKADVKNVNTGPYTLEGTAFFANRADWERFPQFVSLAEKFSFKPSLLEVDGGLSYVYGDFPVLKGAIRMFGLNGKWQLQGNAGVKLIASSRLLGVQATEFAIKLGTLDGAQYIFDVKGKGQIALFPSYILSTQLTGSVRIPTVPGTSAWGNSFNRFFGLPYEVGNITASVYNTDVTFTASSPLSGSRTVVVDISKLPSIAAFDWANSTIVAGRQLKSGGPETASGADTSWTAFATSPEMDRVFITVWRDETVPGTVLRSPNGALYTGTNEDSGVTYLEARQADEHPIWIIKDPLAGDWQVGMVDKTDGDSLYIEGLFRMKEELKLETEQSGKEIIARWDRTGSTNGSMSLFLDSDEDGFDGILVNTIDEDLGEFRFEIDSAMPECGYYVYGVRNLGGEVSFDYSGTYHDNDKTFLTPPWNITAIADPDGKVTVSWNPSIDPDAVAYLIKVTDANGNDSIYTSTVANYTMVDIVVEDWEQKTISIRTLGYDELRGCWSDPVSFQVSSVEAEPVAGEASQGNVATQLVPNPTSETSTLYVNLAKNDVVIVELFDLYGQQIKTFFSGEHPEGTVRAELNMGDYESGTYLLRVTTTQGVSTEKLIVRR